MYKFLLLDALNEKTIAHLPISTERILGDVWTREKWTGDNKFYYYGEFQHTDGNSQWRLIQFDPTTHVQTILIDNILSQDAPFVYYGTVDLIHYQTDGKAIWEWVDNEKHQRTVAYLGREQAQIKQTLVWLLFWEQRQNDMGANRAVFFLAPSSDKQWILPPDLLVDSLLRQSHI